MTRDPRTPVDDLFAQIRACLDAAGNRPGLARASVYQTEGYLKGLQGLAWEAPSTPSLPLPHPATSESAAEIFLRDIRVGSVALRGRLKKHSDECRNAFQKGLTDSFPEAAGKKFLNPLVRLWVRWLAGVVSIPEATDASVFSFDAGRRAGLLLKDEYQEGLSGNLAVFLLDKRLHLINVRDFLRMRGWLLGTIEHLSRSGDAEKRERARILEANLSSIVLRALHNAGPGYAAEAADKLKALTSGLDAAIANLSKLEPEASLFLRNNRSTIITRALHSGFFDYGEQVTETLPSALKNLNSQIVLIEKSSPEKADSLRSNKRTFVYRMLTNGRLDLLKKFPF